MSAKDYIIALLAQDESPITEDLFKDLAEALELRFDLPKAKAKAIVSQVLKQLYATNNPYSEAI